MKPAVFLDRDGTVIVDCGYVRNPADVQLLPGVAAALRSLQERGFGFVIVSNQSGIARGLVTTDQAAEVHQRTEECLAEEGIQLLEAFYCPHLPEVGCACRKPSPHFLRQAAARYELDLAASFMIGDRPSDMETGRRAGCQTILLTQQRRDDQGEATADFVAGSWDDVVGYIDRTRP